MEIEEKAKNMIKKDQASCVIIKDNEIIHTAAGRGVGPLISIYENGREALQDSFVIDKVIGKAAALIIILGQADKAYGSLMSTPAFDFLKARDCKVEYDKMVENIINRSGDDLCPLEKAVLNIEDPKTGYHQLKKTLSHLKKEN